MRLINCQQSREHDVLYHGTEQVVLKEVISSCRSTAGRYEPKMQGTFARVCMVVTAAILNHPLLFPQENATSIAEQDEELIVRMREHQERLERERAKLEEELSQLEEGGEEDGYSWYIWSVVSFVVFFTIEMCRADTGDSDASGVDDELPESGSVDASTMVLDKNILSNFCDQCTYATAHDNGRVREFVEGFTDDLLESLRSVSDREADMEVEDFVGIGSMFECWQVCKPPACDLIVPFSPPDPLAFQVSLWCEPSSHTPPDKQGCGTIQVSLFGEQEGGCLCGSANMGDDMLCLLHGKHERSLDELLCSRRMPLLAKDQVMKWFQVSLTKAWGRISHKYDFEVTFRSLDAAGALKVRFPSGKSVMVNIIPAVQLVDTDAYLVSHFPSDCGSPQDPFWPLSLAVYERNLLKHLTKHLPQHPCHLQCLQVVAFLHRKQTALTGGNALTDYHWKTVLLHLLLLKQTSIWTADRTECRLRDVLDFMHRSLREKNLRHVLIGNSRVPQELQLPQMIRKAEPINLFRSLVLRRDHYAATVHHLQEMMRNAAMLLQEYMPLSYHEAFHY
ncbi:inositol 1,4,5-trisphosphate receptor-interacting protein [Dunckerocampus dactyliophorus]|uniref:inositol 1,4,5-trisphosphate receptor-interacting protein n=1 Tax=Dunckerocampus dactyliophorus TaxID=161453 RepID=UPI00240498B9|nr:inositol 1,4,5-trisphosphate receptor-interacting protein [Dunckerocampus dactyliophorus]